MVLSTRRLILGFLKAPQKLTARVRKAVLLRQFGEVGKDLIFDPAGSAFYRPEGMRIGDHVFIGEQAHFSGEITIGSNVLFGPRPMILAGNHYYAIRGRSVRFLHPRENENSEPVVVEDEVWCGAGVVLLGGVRVGMGSVIGAGSVVCKSIPPFVVAVGNSAKPVRRIFDDPTLRDHLIRLGKDAGFADRTVQRRERELVERGLADLPGVDRTSEYWEFKED
jgi:acetyltransferase-like isoleucine patch superfamily enzyme